MVLNSNNCQNSWQDSINWTAALKNGIFVWSLHHTVRLLLVLCCLWQGFGSHSYWSASFTFHRRCFPPLPLSNYTDSLHHCASSHAFSFPLFPHLHRQKTNPSNVHACLACQTTAQLNSHPAFPEPVGPFWQGSSLCWRSPRCAVLAKRKSLKLQTLPVSDAAIKPGWWKSSASEKEEVRSLTWGI